LEIRFLVKELQVLLDSKFDKIFQSEKKILLLQLHKPKVGKLLVRITPAFLYITKHKEVMPERPLGFSVFLRKYLDNARIRKIEQYKSDRVIDFLIEKKEKFHLMVELFGSGNVILCDEDHKIINPLERQRWKDRVVKKGEQFSSPNDTNMFELSKEEFIKKVLASKRKNLSTTIAMEFNFGGVYARELCLRAKLDSELKKPSSAQISKLFSEFKKLLDEKVNARIILKDSKIKDIVPIKSLFYKDFEEKEFLTFNEALDFVLSRGITEAQTTEVKSRYEKKIEKLEKMIKMQKTSVNNLEKSVEFNQKKGEAIYENYQDLAQILTDLKTIRQKHSWKEIKQKLKGHKKIKRIVEKTGEITVLL